MNQPQLGSYEHIALSAIRPSTTNPRKNFDPAALEELTQSVREMGVTEAITVRPRKPYFVQDLGDYSRQAVTRNIAGRLIVHQSFASGADEENHTDAQAFCDTKNASLGEYELVTGERRYRASLAAGKTDIPAIVKNLSDDEARDQQLVENLQRADLHPIEEAEGYRALMAGGTAGVEDVARKAGKTAGYVAQRLKLLNLELPAKTLFHAGHLTLGHALHLARLTPVDQDRATRELAGLNHLPKKADLVAEVTEMAERHRERGTLYRLIKQTEGELKSWIAGHVLLSLDKVPWSLADPLLVPEAGPCTTCPKRTGANAALFADLTAEDDVCTDPSCFATKQKAVQTVAIQAAAEQGAPLLKLSAKSGHQPLPDDLPVKTVIRQGQWIKAMARSCESVRKGILTDQPSTYDRELQGMKAGDVLTVCADHKCKVHKHTVEKKSASGHVNRNDPAVRSREADYVAAETPVRLAVIQAVKNAAKPGLDEIRHAVLKHITFRAAVCQEMNWAFRERGTSFLNNEEARATLAQQFDLATLPILAQCVLIDDLAATAQPTDWMAGNRDSDRKTLWMIAKRYEVDADAIAARIEAEREATKPKPETKPAKAETKKVSAETQASRKKAAAKKFPGTAKKNAKVLTAAQRKKMKDAFNKAQAERQKKVVPLDGKQKAAGERAETVVA